MIDAAGADIVALPAMQEVLPHMQYVVIMSQYICAETSEMQLAKGLDRLLAMFSCLLCAKQCNKCSSLLLP